MFELSLTYGYQFPRASELEEHTNQVKKVSDQTRIEDGQNKILSAQKEDNLVLLISLVGPTICACLNAYQEEFQHFVQVMDERLGRIWLKKTLSVHEDK